RQPHGDQSHRHVDPEHPAPVDLDQGSADHRPEGRTQRAQRRPGADRRGAGGTAASSSDSDAGTIAPAPAAWTTRAAISAPTPGASAHSTEPRLNPASPSTNRRRRPTRSAQRPAGTSTAANTIV